MKLLSVHAGLLMRWWRYFWRARTIYDVHSPFVADLVQAVVEDTRHFYAFSEIEALRAQLLQNETPLKIKDYGAGSQVNPDSIRTIADLAKNAAIPAEVGRQLFRLVHFCKPQLILELGTSLGISTLYLSAGARNAQVITVEGSPEVAAQAKHHFNILNKPNIISQQAEFQAILPEILPNINKLDFLFLDGDHREAATWAYFEACLKVAHDNSVFVIADIHWSEEMERVWQRLQAHPRVTLSVDLFHLGLLFFRKENTEKEHFTIIKKSYKFWRLGVFS
ncbi:MAG: O-methyltransferase [Saprospiraceae bacterium]